MTILRRNLFLTLFLLWLAGSILWLVLLWFALNFGHEYRYWRDLREDAFVLPFMSFFLGLGFALTWKLFGVTQWLSLPAHIRQGLFRAYLVVAVPWSAWYAYEIFVSVDNDYRFWREISQLLLRLFVVPVGAPLCLMAILWVLAGFRKSPLDRNLAGEEEAGGKPKKTASSDIINRKDIAVAVFLHKNKVKLRTEDLTREQEASLPKQLFAKNGISIDDLAARFGYQSADALVGNLAQFERGRGDTPIDMYIEELANKVAEGRMHPGHSEVPNTSQAVEAIYKKLDRLMTDEKLQCDGLPEPLRSEVLAGDDCDEIVGAIGEFGRDQRNPIPVNGPLGQIIYLSNLRTEKSQQIMFHRLGSAGKIDVYETVSLDGAVWDILFVDLYHPRKSRQAPRGYRISSGAERESLLFGANEFVASFPDHLQDAIANTYERLIGIRMRTRHVREAVERNEFRRPTDHQTRLNSIRGKLTSPKPSSNLFGIGRSLAVVLMNSEECWRDVCCLRAYNVPGPVATCEMAFARAAIAKETIKKCQSGPIAAEMLVGVDDVVNEAFAIQDSPETLEHYGNARLSDVAPKAVRLYERNTVPLTQLADVFGHRISAPSSSATQVTSLFQEVTAAAERWMTLSDSIRKLDL